MTDLKISLNPIVVFIWSLVGGTDKLSPTCDKMDRLVFSCSSYSSCVWLPFSKSDFLQCRVQAQLATSAQLEDRIVNPDLRNHSLRGPIINPEIMTGRAPYWASGAKNAAKIVSPQLCSSCWSAKLHLKQKVTTFWLHGCTFDHLSSFLPWRTASVIFYSRGPNCNQNSTVSEILRNCWILYF